MDPVERISEPVLRIPKPNPRRRRRFALAMLGMLLLSITPLLTLASRPGPPFAWLTQAEMARLTNPGPLTRLKDKLMNLTAPLWRRYWNTQPEIGMGCRLLTLSAAAADQTGLSAAVATNSNGVRAWTLSPAELGRFLQRLKTTPGVSLLSRPRLQTLNGVTGQMFIGSTGYVVQTNTPVEVMMDLIPQVSSGSVRLTLRVTSTETVNLPSGYPAAVRTNLAVACRVWLPNAGGLVLNGGNARAGSGTNHWLIISPTAFDAQGHPIKP